MDVRLLKPPAVLPARRLCRNSLSRDRGEGRTKRFVILASLCRNSEFCHSEPFTAFSGATHPRHPRVFCSVSKAGLLPVGRLFFVDLWIDSQFLDLVLDDALCCPQHLCGLSLVAAGCFEHVQDQRFLLGFNEG